MKKRLVSLLLTVVLTASLCACGAKDAPQDAVGDAQTGTETEVVTDIEGAEDKEEKAEENAQDASETSSEESKEQAAPTLETAQPGDVVDGIVKVAKRAPLEIPDNEALSFIRDLEIGWNLGNTFDASECTWLSDEMGYETAWCNA
ncbi:MAG: hypothetical protein IKQ28_04110, partial [Lachnospiraceae bacterium]|nr:hypothetical protein [Lachnospiraceae bacterium]